MVMRGEKKRGIGYKLLQVGINGGKEGESEKMGFKRPWSSSTRMSTKKMNEYKGHLIICLRNRVTLLCIYFGKFFLLDRDDGFVG